MNIFCKIQTENDTLNLLVRHFHKIKSKNYQIQLSSYACGTIQYIYIYIYIFQKRMHALGFEGLLFLRADSCTLGG